MKKLGAMLAVIVVLIGGVTFAIMNGNKGASDMYTFIEGPELQAKVDNKEDFVVYVYGEYCSYCKQFAPTIEGYLKEKDYNINKIVEDTNADNSKVIRAILGEDFQGTPAIYVFKKGEMIDYMIGLQTKEELDKFATKNETYFSAKQS